MGNPLKLVLRAGTDRRTGKAGAKTGANVATTARDSRASPPSRRAKRAG